MSWSSEVISMSNSINTFSLNIRSANYVWFGLRLESPVSDDSEFWPWLDGDCELIEELTLLCPNAHFCCWCNSGCDQLPAEAVCRGGVWCGEYCVLTVHSASPSDFSQREQQEWRREQRCLGTGRQGGSRAEPRVWTSLSLIQILSPGAAEVPFMGTP